MINALRYSTMSFYTFFFVTAILHKIYNTQKSKNFCRKTDRWYDREVSRDRIVLQRIIDRSYTSDGYFYFYFHDSWINYHEHRFDVPSRVICGHSLMKKRYCMYFENIRLQFRRNDSIVIYVNLTQLKNRASKSRCSREEKKFFFWRRGFPLVASAVRYSN